MKAKLILALLLSVSLAGCSSNESSKNNDQNSQSTSTSQSVKSTQTKSTLSTVKVSLVTAIKTYQQTFSNSDITGLSLEKELGRYQYEVEGVDDSKEHSLKLDANTGKILTKKSESLDADETNGAERSEKVNLNKLISVKRAVELAQKKAQEMTATEISLDQETNQTYWDVQFEHQGKETSVKLDSQTGRILDVEHDD